jgi:hypothetical protein
MAWVLRCHPLCTFWRRVKVFIHGLEDQEQNYFTTTHDVSETHLKPRGIRAAFGMTRQRGIDGLIQTT